MGRLVLINGAPGVGKSTVARRFADDNPLTLVLDIDIVRGLLGAWIRTPSEAGELARGLALGMARIHLGTGNDVVVPQLLAQNAFVERLAAVAAETASPFVEIALVNDPDEAEERFRARSRAPENTQHRDARDLQRLRGTPSIRDYAERVLAVAGTRPGTVLVDAPPGDIDGTYRRLLAALPD